MKKHYKKYLRHIKKYLNFYLIGLAVIISIPLLFIIPAGKEQLHNSADARTNLTVELPLPDGSYSIFSDTNKFILHDKGLSRSFNLPDGTYRIEFAQIYGYTTPHKQVFTLNSSGEAVIKGKYYPVYNAPLLSIKVFPEYASYKIYDLNKNLIQENSGSQFLHMPPGQYRIQFADVPGYSSPGTSTFYLAGAVITTINGVYGEK